MDIIHPIHIAAGILRRSGLFVVAALSLRWPWLSLILFWIVYVVKMAVILYVPALRLLDITALAARDRFCRMFEAGGLIRDLEEVYSSIQVKRRGG